MQVLLLLCGGAIAGQLPIMVAVYLAMSNGWLGAVGALSRVANYVSGRVGEGEEWAWVGTSGGEGEGDGLVGEGGRGAAGQGGQGKWGPPASLADWSTRPCVPCRALRGEGYSSARTHTCETRSRSYRTDTDSQHTSNAPTPSVPQGHQSTVHDSLTASMDEVPHTTAGGGSAGGSGASGSSSSSHSSSGNSHNGHGGHHNGNGNGHHHNHHVATAVTHGNGNGNGAQASHNGHNGNGNGHHNGHHTVIVAGESATVAGFVHSEHNGHTGQNAAAAEAVRAAAA